MKVLAYQPGLDKVQEAAVSSHFMHRFGANERPNNYSDGEKGSPSRPAKGARRREMLRGAWEATILCMADFLGQHATSLFRRRAW